MSTSYPRRPLNGAAAAATLALALGASTPAQAAPSVSACQQAKGQTIQQDARWRVFSARPAAGAFPTSLTICGRSKATRSKVWRIRPSEAELGITATMLAGGDLLELVQSDERTTGRGLLVDLRRGRVASLDSGLLPTGAVVRRDPVLADAGGGSLTVTAYGDLTLFGPSGPKLVAPGVQGQGAGNGPTGVVSAPSSSEGAGIYFTTGEGRASRVAAPGPATGLTWSAELRPFRGRLERTTKRPYTDQVQNHDAVAQALLRVPRDGLQAYTLRSMTDPNAVLATLAPRSLPDYRLLDAAEPLRPGITGLMLVQARFDDSTDRVPQIRVLGPNAPTWEGTPPSPTYVYAAAAVSPAGSVAIASGDQVRRWRAVTEPGAERSVLREITPLTVPGAHGLAFTSSGWLYATDAAGNVHGSAVDRPGSTNPEF